MRKEYYQRNKEKILQHIHEYQKLHKEKIKQRKKEYYLKHKEEISQYHRNYYREHKEELLKRRKERYEKNKEYELQRQHEYYKQHKENYKNIHHNYYEAHKDEIKRRVAEYQSANKDKHNERNRKYRATLKGYINNRLHRWRYRGMKISSWQMYVDAYNRAGGKCQMCGKPLKLTPFDDGDFEVARLDHDHETGEIRGILCNECNRIAVNFDLNKKVVDYLRRGEVKAIIPAVDDTTPAEVKAEREYAWRKQDINISWGEYVALYNMAGGRCEICGKPLSLSKVHGVEVANVDHDHISGRPRGIVCRRCNSLIKTMELNEKALKYLGGEKL